MSDARPTIADLPHALHAGDRWQQLLGGRVPVIFLDYDGVLTPIVDDPAAATLGDRARAAVVRTAQHLTVAVISGRDLDDVRAMVDVDGLTYAGSHGFDMISATGERERKGEEFLGDLDDVERVLRDDLSDLEGVAVERKAFAIAVHTRRARDPAVRHRAADVVAAAAAEHPRLRVTGGKDIEEFRPGIVWDKGHALRRLMAVLELDAERHPPIYVGDDLTDEDAFAAIEDIGVGVVVAGEDDRPTYASLRLDDPGETADLLDLVVARAGERQG